MTFDVKGDLENFLIRPKNVAGHLSGSMEVDGEGSKIALKGDLTVSRARITIPETEERQVEEITFVDEREDEFTVEAGQPTDYFKEDISMDLRVRMRKNNWVRGRGANIELRGDLDIKKAYGEDMRIVGNISTIRGTYENFGKLFRIVQGNVSFSGTSDINPFLDIRALYRVSGVEIYVNISGTAQKPVVELTSDPPMSETDMVSYIVFGAPSDRISTSDRASIQGVASGLAGGVAAAQLERMLGSKFKLDVVSIGTGTQGPELEVGKYLTEDLYFAVERQTSQSLTDSTTVTQTKVIIEYTIFKNISINGDIGGENPGVDVFYNFNY
jgi:translocation and assembly module TamB